jgi:hypothetical protein
MSATFEFDIPIIASPKKKGARKTKSKKEDNTAGLENDDDGADGESVRVPIDRSKPPTSMLYGSPPITRETPQFYIDPRIYAGFINWHKEDMSQLQQALQKRNEDQALSYMSRALCAEPLGEKLISIVFRYYFSAINIGCLWVLPYLSQFYNYYQDVKKKDRNHTWCNDQQWRNFAFFIIPVMCQCSMNIFPKAPSFHSYDFDFSNKHDLISKSLDLIQPYILPNDDKVSLIPLSEIIHYLVDATALPYREERISYWLYWLLAYEKHAYNGDMPCSPRSYHPDIPTTSAHDWIWIVWHILLDLQNESQEHYFYYLFMMFLRGYTKGKKKSRLPILLCAVRIFVHPTRITPSATTPSVELYAHCMRTSLNSNVALYNVYSDLTRALGRSSIF